ncbi:hypothetical protein [Bartonella doshiae]|uniref:hypothetical protein n=1 Tax=Bartonella doshiae TaxID=33044 RepID=UPI000B2DC937|nr:hypothetical protein [Bartonella doshiae]
MPTVPPIEAPCNFTGIGNAITKTESVAQKQGTIIPIANVHLLQEEIQISLRKFF